MLKNIRLHIESDEIKQEELEQRLSQHISKTRAQNLNTIQRRIPSLVPFFSSTETKNISIIANKFGEFNIVNFNTGRVFYGENPKVEINEHLQCFYQSALEIDINDELEQKEAIKETDNQSIKTLASSRSYNKRNSIVSNPSLIVVLGLGIGDHLHHLIDELNVDHIIVYEPELQFVKCSGMVVNWKSILELAEKKNTKLYFQFGKDGRELINDLQELQAHFPIDNAYIYKHYNHPIFDCIYHEIENKNWKSVFRSGFSFENSSIPNDYVSEWTAPVKLESWKDVSVDNSLFNDNLLAFKEYFPEIYAEFRDYQTKYWLPIIDEKGQVNIINKKRLTSFYWDLPTQECVKNYEGFKDYPNKDGIVLGYTGTKLKDYLHYRFVKQSTGILSDLEEEQGGLDTNVKSLIMFGLGAGYQLENLVGSHDIENLFICEPNRDFFYASLFAINWSELLEKIDHKQHRLYLNIGDDGTNLFKDLVSQFYSIGPYILSNTYFYQSYYNRILSDSLSQLREQLRVVVSMGEYYDHARFGITHTKTALQRGYHILKKNASRFLDFESKNIPIFLVGNGPSIDEAIEAIREYKNQAIIVSCGTSLQVLYKQGIVPDFHAEIEQNRSTFDWAARIKDDHYLSQIKLISCNGIHPDTCELYKDTYIAFKSGESSTESMIRAMGEKEIETLDYAFPTVANFALNFFVSLGSQQIYLLGIDLGFVDVDKHHSKLSGYYSDKGVPLYSYKNRNDVSLTVPGNFRQSVSTKHEFKVSKVVLEQTLAANKGITCYNCSDGALIQGTTSLQPYNILVSTSVNDKNNAALVFDQAFLKFESDEVLEKFYHRFSDQEFERDVESFFNLLNQPIASKAAAVELVENQRKQIFHSYKKGESLFFYLFYGTLNYANAMLSKILSCSSTDETVLPAFSKAQKLWRETFLLMVAEWQDKQSAFDGCSSLAIYRINSRSLELLKQHEVSLMFLDQQPSEEFASFIDRCNATSHIYAEIGFLEAEQQPGFKSSDRVLIHTQYLSENQVSQIIKLSNVYPSKHFIVSVHNIQSKLNVDALLIQDNVMIQLLWNGIEGSHNECSLESYMYSLETSNRVFMLWALTTDTNVKIHIPRLKYIDNNAKLIDHHDELHSFIFTLFNEDTFDWFRSAHILQAQRKTDVFSQVDRQLVRSNKISGTPCFDDLVYATLTEQEAISNMTNKGHWQEPGTNQHE